MSEVRRDRRCASVLVAVLVAAGAATAGAPAAGAHPPIDDTNVAQLSRAWSATVDGPGGLVVSGTTLVAVTPGRVTGFAALDTSTCDTTLTCRPRWSDPLPARSTTLAAAAGTMVFVPTEAGLVAYAIDGSRCTLSGSSCTAKFVAPTPTPIVGRPAVAGTVVAVGQENGTVLAFDTQGVASCNAWICAPVWRAEVGTDRTEVGASGTVLAAVAAGGTLAVIDTADSTRCTGSTCAPVWHTDVGSARGAPAVGERGIAVSTAEGLVLYPLDPGAQCAADAHRCSPRWRATTTSPLTPPLLAGGRVVVGSAAGAVLQYDAGGTSGCGGTPLVCTPLWRADLGEPVSVTPTLVSGVVYAGGDHGRLAAYDAAGRRNCAGVPVTCSPRWTTTGLRAIGPVATASASVFAASTAGRVVALRALLRTPDPRVRARSLSSQHDDVYGSSPVGGGATYTAPTTNTGGQTRIAVTTTASPIGTDHEACVTWTAQSSWIDQEGVALRVRQAAAGATTAITVTKNVWLGAAWIFNVHVWNASGAYSQIATFDLESVFYPDGNLAPLPWHLCGRVAGAVVSLVAWPDGEQRPAYGDVTHGGSVSLPPGYSAPGRPGWYVGHLLPGHAVTYRETTTSDLTPAPVAGPVRTPTDEQRLP
jgi:hypothetical protein